MIQQQPQPDWRVVQQRQLQNVKSVLSQAVQGRSELVAATAVNGSTTATTATTVDTNEQQQTSSNDGQSTNE